MKMVAKSPVRSTKEGDLDRFLWDLSADALAIVVVAALVFAIGLFVIVTT